jgi:ATP-dependent Clp protease ATP-binding subunit ClpA
VQRLLSSIGRYSPLIMLVFLLLALLQLGMQFGVNAHDIARMLLSASWIYVGVGVIAWCAVLAGLVHGAGAWPRRLSNGWTMDILDRLTNKTALERLAAGENGPVVIDADDLAARLKARVIGQDAVCDDVAAQIRRRLALNQRGKPVGVFLFAGPPGTGKTYLGKRLAAEMKLPMLHLDMAQFSTPHAATQIFGSPKGYVGSDSYGKLTATLRDSPDIVVLLDEFEKAHDEVHKKFLTAWNDGFVTEASDARQISTTRAIFIVTTNAATVQLTEIALRHAGNRDEMRQASVDALRAARFAPEVLNRIDRIFIFTPLQGLDVARVAALEIEAMIAGYGLEVAEGGIDPQLLFDIMRGQGRLGDAASSRDLVRTIEEAISDSLIEAKQRKVIRVSLVANGDKIVAVPA